MSTSTANSSVGHQQALQEIRKVFQENRNPQKMAENSGASYIPEGERGTFILSYCGDDCKVSYPDGNVTSNNLGEEVSAKDQIVLLTYLVKAVSIPERDEWKTFKDLSVAPLHWNLFINEAINALTKGFGEDLEAFQGAAERLGGQPVGLGDVGYQFYVLPRIAIQVGIWAADEEFPAQVTILFNGTAQMQADVATLYALGIYLVRKLLYMAGKRESY